jgi:hypothetical protein
MMALAATVSAAVVSAAMAQVVEVLVVNVQAVEVLVVNVQAVEVLAVEVLAVNVQAVFALAVNMRAVRALAAEHWQVVTALAANMRVVVVHLRRIHWVLCQPALQIPHPVFLSLPQATAFAGQLQHPWELDPLTAIGDQSPFSPYQKPRFLCPANYGSTPKLFWSISNNNPPYFIRPHLFTEFAVVYFSLEMGHEQVLYHLFLEKLTTSPPARRSALPPDEHILPLALANPPMSGHLP